MKCLDPYETHRYSSRLDYYQEILWLAKKHKVKPSQVEIDPFHPTGEVCIFINNVWYGYIDTEFYNEMIK